MASSVKTPALCLNCAVTCPECGCMAVNPPISPVIEQTGFSVSKVSKLSTSLCIDHFIQRLSLCLEVTGSTGVQYLCVTVSPQAVKS